MAPFLFTKAIFENTPIRVFNNGNMKRDFTFIDDIVEGIIRVIDHVPARPLFKVYNIGYGRPVDLMTFIETIEKSAGKKAKKEFLPMQPGDVPVTWADTAGLEADTGYRPKTGTEEGVPKFVEWYRHFYL
jgi:UDP-glucuronate 4-epimerase